MLYIGVDLGGTNIKAALVDEKNSIVAEADRPTNLPRPPEEICDDILGSVQDVLDSAGIGFAGVAAMGIGCPGSIDSERGIVSYSNNLDFHNFPMVAYLKKSTGLYTVIGNDANVAALGEVAAGCAKGASSAVIITLGTGVGSGIVLDGQILTGYGGGASEIGHTVIQNDGWECTCGRKGCFEAYSSATGLIRMTNEAIERYPGSRMAEIAKEQGEVNGRTAFDAMRESDSAGIEVVEKYLRYFACGITNIVNTFQPEVIALSGGISKEGETLLAPLRIMVNAEMFGGPPLKKTRFEICTLGYKAGLIGAATLAKQSLVTSG